MLAYKYITIFLFLSVSCVLDKGARPNQELDPTTSKNVTTLVDEISNICGSLLDCQVDNYININIQNNRNDSHAIEQSRKLKHYYTDSVVPVNSENHGIPVPESSALIITLNFLIVGFSVLNMLFTIFMIVQLHKTKKYNKLPTNERLGSIVMNESERQSWTV